MAKFSTTRVRAVIYGEHGGNVTGLICSIFVERGNLPRSCFPLRYLLWLECSERGHVSLSIKKVAYANNPTVMSVVRMVIFAAHRLPCLVVMVYE